MVTISLTRYCSDGHRIEWQERQMALIRDGVTTGGDGKEVLRGEGGIKSCLSEDVHVAVVTFIVSVLEKLML